LNIIRRNSKLIGEEGNIHTIKCDLKNGLPKLKQKYNLIFIDPPYNKNFTEKIFLDLENLNYLEKKHLIIVESSKKEELKFNRYKFKILKERVYGNSRFGFLTKS
jgi:16S rRNA (guanine966-N2)-methyltransferase